MTLHLAPEPRFPMPGQHFPGRRTVIASCTYRDLLESDLPYKAETDTWPNLVYLVLLLNAQPPYYTVAHIDPISWAILDSEDFLNINPATAGYADSGGDW